jgi:hypothetical protein
MPSPTFNQPPHFPPLRAGLILLASASLALPLAPAGCAAKPAAPTPTVGTPTPTPGSPATAATPLSPDRPALLAEAIPPERYAEVFDAARDELRAMGFKLERLDAGAGVILTRFKGTAGFFTPWDREQDGLEDELREAVNREGRVVRVQFQLLSAEPLPAGSDLRLLGRHVAMSIRVERFRVQRPNWQVQTTGVLISSRAVNPEAVAQGQEPATANTLGPDEALAQRLREAIIARATRAASATPSSQSPRGDDRDPSAPPAPAAPADSPTSGPESFPPIQQTPRPAQP